MARSRNIKPGFFRNADLAELSFEARLLFIGVWTLADREGRLEDRPKQIKMEIFPADNLDCDGVLNDLADTGMIVRYQVDGKRYLQVTNFCKHQNPHKDEKQSTIPAQGLHSASTVQAPCKDDASTMGILLIPDSLLLIPEETPCSPSASESADDGFTNFWQQYPKKVAKPQALKAWRKIKPTGQTLADLMAGLESQKAGEQWRKDGGLFIPHPASWLNGRRWEDEAPAAGQSAPLARNPIFAGAI
ncbi:hypothetical protein [Dechloromonas denitrificans]|uniref:hypothetical protein n=1 Tax=Dechloromonas denitrificans TaxID=281362 RepID=UPI001CF81801|nr:hypothetical protein [Dechloromonas denitrificans]UCV01745.1 hypothetical protein KI611_11485 [Dechloromonas denitrificans]